MKILYLGGAKSWHTQKWLEYFIEAGHEVHLLSRDSNANVKHNIVFHPKIRIHFVKEISKISGVRLFLTLPKAVRELRQLIYDIKPDILHAYGLRHYGLWGALSDYHPYIVTPIGSDAIVYARRNLVDKYLAKIIYRKCDVLIGASELLLQSAQELGMNKEKCFLIQNGVDRRMFNDKIDRDFLRRKLKLDKNTNVVISPRGLESLYNIDIIVRAILDVLKTKPNTHFVFFYAFGERHYNTLIQLVDELKVRNFVTFLNYIPYEEVPLTLASADVVVSIPSTDSSPRSVYESMAVGVPCILSEISWTKSFIIHGENAIIVPPRDEKSVAKAIVELLENKRLIKNITEKSKRLVADKLDYHKNMGKMESIYKSLTTRREIQFHSCA